MKVGKKNFKKFHFHTVVWFWKTEKKNSGMENSGLEMANRI